ncbi:Peroxisomal NADH pyrophosphatase nudt12 [Actinomortierella ambigua]|nr:Peroxisomal NADH pyrophosphatase nudt12 [Actinomortierella ambigua]
MTVQKSNIFEDAATGNLESLKALDRQRLEAKNDRGWTPLMFAARYGHAALVEYLLGTAKVDANAVNKEGKTAADLAEFWGATEALAILDKYSPRVPQASAPQGVSSTPSATAGGQGQVVHEMADWWKRKTVYAKKPHHFAGSVLNRLSFLRTDKDYLNASLQASTTKFLLFSGHGVLFQKTTRDLAYLNAGDVASLIGDKPLENLPEGLTLVFLGADETERQGNNSGGSEVLVGGRRGVNYWALDITAKGPLVSESLKAKIEDLTKQLEDQHGHYFAEMRPASFMLRIPESGIVSQARALLDWNRRNQFCAACGQKNMMMEGGHKRACPPTITQEGQEVPSECLAHQGVQNFTYPRTDPVVITCVISKDGERTLLGRQAVWPPGMYSCLAGFVEPGESLEEAARREVKEESGVGVGHVMYHSSQPWPFPNSLMIGCLAEALTEDIDITKEDKELDDARWFTRQEVLEAIKTGISNGPTGTLKLPPGSIAIARHILAAWANNEGDLPTPRM